MYNNLEILQKRIIKEFELRIGQSINIEEFEKIYKRAKEVYEFFNESDFIEPKEFANQYLHISASSFKALKGGFQNAKILKKYEINLEEVQKIRRKILYENKLHCKDMKTYEELRQYYENYFTPLQEKEFFEKMLDINSNTLRGLILHSKKQTLDTNVSQSRENVQQSKSEILKNENVLIEEIEALKKECIKKELLHRKDKINYKRFLEIYNKYYISLSVEDFAAKILDINKKSYTKIKFYPDSEAVILTSIDLPEDIRQIRRNIMQKEKLHRGDDINYERFNEILNNNYLPISRADFAKYFLDISKNTFNSSKYDDNRNMRILMEEPFDKDEIAQLRKQIIEDYKLHKGDDITYKSIQEMYNKYYLPLSEEEFAKEILDVERATYLGIKYGNRDCTKILKNEDISNDRIQKIKKEILKEFHLGEKVSYKDVEYIYRKYFLPFSIKEYAKYVLDIEPNVLKDLRNKKSTIYDNGNPSKSKIKKLKTRIFLGDELENLKNTILSSNYLYNNLEITRDYFFKLYKQYPHALSYMTFGKLILGINIYTTNALILGRNRTVNISTNLRPDKDESNKKKFLKLQENKIEELLYKGKTLNEISEELMLSRYDIDSIVKDVISKRKLDEQRIKKERIRQKLFAKTGLYKIAIQLKLSIDEVKNISKDIIAEEICEYIENGLTLDEAFEEIKIQLLSDKKEDIKNDTKHKIDKKKNIIKVRAKKVVSIYIGEDPRQEEVLRNYIDICKQDFVDNNFDNSEIDTLEKSILCLDTDKDNIEFFVRLCIKQGEYIRANKFVGYYLGDLSFNKKEKEMLTQLYEDIKEGIKRRNIVNMLFIDKKTKEEISKQTGGRETDIIGIEREIKNKKLENLIREIL